MNRQTCTDHAVCCDRHFHSLKSFDLHRRGMTCNDPATIPNLQIWTENGSCDKMPGCFVNGERVKYIEPVVIWQVKESESDRKRLAALSSRR